MKRQYILMSLFFFLYQYVKGQTFSSEERRIQVELILNTVINSTPFDSVYSHKRVYFLANELLKENSTLVLKRNKCKAKILNKSQIKKVKEYVVLGDFTLDWNNPFSVRVQLSVSSNKTLNMILEKEKDMWKIKNHLIFEE